MLRGIQDMVMDIANMLSPVRSPIPPSQARRLMEQSERLAEAARRLREVADQAMEPPTKISHGPRRPFSRIDLGGSPQAQQRPAPRRTETFVYGVTLGNRTYSVTLPEQLPTRADGTLDIVAARERLHGMLLNNELVSHGPDGRLIQRAQVTMTGSAGRAAAFNTGAPNQRLDLFRDQYLSMTFQGGQYVARPDVAITLAQAEVPRRRSR